jgi:DNA-binding XRE family transcriptional regulator
MTFWPKEGLDISLKDRIVLCPMPMTGPELKRCRERLKLTQAAMAKQIGVHSNSLARMERNEMTISEPVSRLVRLILKVSKDKR